MLEKVKSWLRQRSRRPIKLRYWYRDKRCRMVILDLPFVGQYAYEMQIGPVVIQFWYKTQKWSQTAGIGRLRFWHDTAWMR